MTGTTEIRSITQPLDGSTEFESVYCQRNSAVLSPLKTSISYDTSIVTSPSTISADDSTSSFGDVSVTKSSTGAYSTTTRTRRNTSRHYTHRQRHQIMKEKTPLSARKETGINLKKITALPARYGELC
mmetsp:Transcript_23396/g.26236  ORF Transcript_23396/g.26236 Transcript_23396/m.26236 type:complete len:128 (+) Transcript_23396:83-466(+)|eukprot:CAMPEP_0170909238 /NCGR_PEP_ID=MMETSP0735-20130129/2401_1 /TAXON_ID=186038 /ORGANISM="Fragilariopsis kerguelensis, Strain L26-C5" /LENGTH=127 /DNA_ID=CAMNT_0011305753 /DNA_START=84 /DNA_END=467 /DNA_ORIENTATION=+